MTDIRTVSLTFAASSLASNIMPIPASSGERGDLAAVEVDLHSNFPTATVVELRFADADNVTPGARHDDTGTLISFAGAASRQVALDPADYPCVKNYCQLVSNTTIATGGICAVLFRGV